MKQHTFIHKGLSRLWYALIILMLLIPCFHIALADTGYSGGETAIVSNPDPADRLNLRKSPSESAESLGKYYNGVAVQLDEPIQNGWVRVTIGADGGSAQGYMLAQYLAFDQAAQNVAPATPLYQTVSNKWSLRATPSDSGKKLSIRYASGMQVELLGFTSSWWHVRVNNQTGYIMHNPSAFKQISGNYYDGYRIGIVNNPNAADRLNLRNQAKDNATSLGKYYNGCPVALLSGEKNGWVNVRIGNLEGYMQSRYLTLDATLGSIPSAMPNVTIRNASGTGLNLRESPMQNSSSLALYANGTSVQVLGLSKNWYHVQVDGKTGFMMADKFSPRLSYSSTEESASSSGSSESGSNSGNSSNKDDKTGWDGPISTHKTAKWPFEANDYQAAVNNPKASDRLHLRTEASEKAASLGKYYNGVLLTVTGKTANGWTPVAIGNLQGYMKTSYLVFSGKGTSIPRSAMPIMTVYNPNSEACADLLDGQSLNSNFLGVYPNGTSVLLMGFSDEWAHVIVDGQMGFMQGKYLK